jgi:hypothetical protein
MPALAGVASVAHTVPVDETRGTPLRPERKTCLMERTLVTLCVGSGRRPWGQRRDRPREVEHDARLHDAQRRP